MADAIMRTRGGFFGEAFYVVRVGVVMYAEGDFEANEGIAVAPVYYALGDEFLVWNKERFIVARDNFSIACSHVIDPPECAVFKLYDVAGFDGAVSEKQYSGEEV